MDLHAVFILKGGKVNVHFNSQKLEWSSESTHAVQHSYHLSEIISCWLCPKGKASCHPSSYLEENRDVVSKCRHWEHSMHGALAIEVCERRRKLRWVPKIYIMQHASEDILYQWYSVVNKLLNDITDRPRQLRVVINPVSGKANSENIYNTKVMPLFKRAGIHTKVIMTECKGHATRLLQDISAKGELDSCDGVVTVGGDGLVSEIALGMILSVANEVGTNPHDVEAELPRTRLRLGVIPGGSTDAICHAAHGASDPTTACLHIIMGDNRNVDVGMVYAEGELQRIFLSQISYGWFGDLLCTSEKLRNLGPSRYIVSGARQMLRNKKYQVNIKVKDQTVNKPRKNSLINSISCNSICTTCSTAEDTGNVKSEPISDWVELDGKYNVVSAAVTSCACRFSPQGVSPSAHLGDGFSELLLISTSRSGFLSYIYNTMLTSNRNHHKVVNATRTNEIHLQGTNKSAYSCDGELLRTDSIRIKIHRQKLRFFCRGVEVPFPVTKKKTLAKPSIKSYIV